MNWYAAHVVMFVEWKEEAQAYFPVWENIILIKADSEEEAFAKAEKRGREDADDDDETFRWGGKPARWVFAGVRKITSCQDEEKRPGDGTEVSFLEMELLSKDTIKKYVRGEPVSVKVAERFGLPAGKR